MLTKPNLNPASRFFLMLSPTLSPLNEPIDKAMKEAPLSPLRAWVGPWLIHVWPLAAPGLVGGWPVVGARYARAREREFHERFRYE